MTIPNSSFHVKFFNSRKELFKSALEVCKKDNYIFISGDPQRKAPLWHTIKQGIVLNVDEGK
jgi:hypothetical protein